MPTPSTDEFSLQTTPWRNISVLICLNVNTSWLSIIYGLGFSRSLFPECELGFIKMEGEEQVLKTEWCHFMSLLLLINQMVNVKMKLYCVIFDSQCTTFKSCLCDDCSPRIQPSNMQCVSNFCFYSGYWFCTFVKPNQMS